MIDYGGQSLAANWWREKGAKKIGQALDTGISWSETEQAFAPEVEGLAEVRDYDPEGLSEGQKETAHVRAAEQTGKMIAAQQKALQDPSAVGEQTASSIKRAQAIAGEGAEAAAEGAASTSAQIEALSEEIEQGERQWKSSEIQRMLANIASFREMKRQRMDDIFAMVGGGISSLLDKDPT